MLRRFALGALKSWLVVAFACGVTPVGEVAAILMKHLGLQSVAARLSVAGYDRLAALWCPVQAQGRSGNGDFCGVVSRALDTRSQGKAAKMRRSEMGEFTAELSALL